MITQNILKENLRYCPKTGIFTWIRMPKNHMKIGGSAGTPGTRGYIQIKINGAIYLAHRLAFLYMNGYQPKSEVDHIDHVTSNNKWDNLREVSHQDNMKNRSIYKNNTSGITGVNWDKFNKKWKAQIKAEGRIIHLGRFEDIRDAALARLYAEDKYGFHKNHGASS